LISSVDITEIDVRKDPIFNQRDGWELGNPDAIHKRIEIAEFLGELGAEKLAKRNGWICILNSKNKNLPHGFDQVYLAPNGRVIVVEAKGGTSQPGMAYGHPQGSIPWALEVADRTLSNPKTSQKERDAALQVLKAAKDGRLEAWVVRTEHVAGRGTRVKAENIYRVSNEFAKRADNLLQAHLRVISPNAPTNGKGSTAARSASGPASPVTHAGSPSKSGSQNASRQPAEPGEHWLRGTTSGAARGAIRTEQVKVPSQMMPRTSGPAPVSAGGGQALALGTPSTPAVANPPSVSASGIPPAAAKPSPSATGALKSGAKVAVPGAAKALGVAGVAIDFAVRTQYSMEVEASYDRGEIGEKARLRAHAENAGGFAGGCAVGAAGGYYGAITGAAIGTAICPGLGTAIGAWIGGIAGAFGGYHVGDKVGAGVAGAAVEALEGD